MIDKGFFAINYELILTMVERIIIAGSGGQGIMLLGKLLAQSVLRQGFNVTWLPTYGAEVRGGAAYCMVIISSDEIPSPYVDKADTLIVMNEPSLIKLKKRIRNKGLLFVNSSLVNQRDFNSKSLNHICFWLPFTEVAVGLGNIRVANMVALGAYIQRAGILSKQTVLTAIQDITPEDKRHLIEINQQALEQGMRLIK